LFRFLSYTGPYKVNGCPLRRINQRYAIATSTKLPVTAKSFADIADADFACETVRNVAGVVFVDGRDLPVRLVGGNPS
jgi:ribosomal protein L14E/L6E/L27E